MILLKRYGMPAVISVALYSMIYFIFGRGEGYLNAGLALSVMLSYLIRVCDDISDYEADREKGKAILSKKALVAMCFSLAVVCLAVTVIWGKYLMLIAPVIIIMQFTIKKKYRDIIKPLFMPAIVVTLTVSCFKTGVWLYPISAVLFVFDAALIVYKKRRRRL